MLGHADPVAASTAAWEQHAQARIAAGDIDKRPAVHRFRWTCTGAGDPGIEILGDIQGKRVVELGCGAGDNLAYLVDHCGARGIGIDPAPSQIYRARARWPNPIFHCTDAVRYLATCGPVDVFYSVFGAVGRCPPEALFSQIHERLKPAAGSSSRCWMSLRRCVHPQSMSRACVGATRLACVSGWRDFDTPRSRNPRSPWQMRVSLRAL